MKLVLDTDALWHPGLNRELAAAHASGDPFSDAVDVVLPAVAYAERLRQVQDDKARKRAFQRQLSRIDPSIEPFGSSEAALVAERCPSQGDWADHARDFLIAAHVHGDRVAVTGDQGPAWDAVDHLEPDHAAELLGALLG